jgi:4-amino-4-deoxy-L-arabinose transferase-like glycosyltransferase
VVLSYVLVGLVALLVRADGLGEFITVDEVKFWLPRSENFLQALQGTTYEAMPLVGHPGVTTMWLGSAGIALRQALFEGGVLHTETFPVLLALHRLPTVLVHVVGVLTGYYLLRQMFPAVVALLAAWLWATDPFVIAFSQILHVDALAGTFATMSLLAACCYWHHAEQFGWLLLSAASAGLAVLSKLPALAVVPVVVVLALVARRTAQARLVAWGVLCAATVVVLWPVVWVDLDAVVEAVRFGVESEGGQPHMWGNFFLGRSVETPGPLFYPVALAMRTTPWSLAGLLVLPWAMRAMHSDADGSRVRDLAVLAGFVIFFVVAMSLFSKKMNRYLVPVFPSLDILAAVGLAWLAQRVAGWRGWWRGWSRAARGAVQPGFPSHSGGGRGSTVRFRAVVALLALVALFNAAWYNPYGVAYFNQFLGGPPAGARTFLAGWGEGFGQVAAWLNERPDIGSVVTVTSLPSVLNPYLGKHAYASSDTRGGLPGSSGYLVVYLSQLQRHLVAPYDGFYGHIPPLHTVTIHGVDYAWIYQVPREMEHALQADFGSSLRLRGYNLDTSALRASGTLTLTAQWQVRAPPPDDYHMFVHVLNADGERVGQLDVPLTDPHEPTSAWQPGRVIRWVHPLPVARDIPAGTYWVGIGVYHPDDLSRVVVEGPSQPASPDDGPHVLFLEPVVVAR